MVFRLIIFTTVLCLTYINLQMKIISLAYLGKEKEKAIHQLVEENSRITYTVLRMKSSNNLGTKMFSENSNMKFVESDNIIQISASEQFLEPEVAQQASGKNSSFIDPLISLISRGTQAEAGAK